MAYELLQEINVIPAVQKSDVHFSLVMKHDLRQAKEPSCYH